jgi:hypothetical protein
MDDKKQRNLVTIIDEIESTPRSDAASRVTLMNELAEGFGVTVSQLCSMGGATDKRTVAGWSLGVKPHTRFLNQLRTLARSQGLHPDNQPEDAPRLTLLAELFRLQQLADRVIVIGEGPYRERTVPDIRLPVLQNVASGTRYDYVYPKGSRAETSFGEFAGYYGKGVARDPTRIRGHVLHPNLRMVVLGSTLLLHQQSGGELSGFLHLPHAASTNPLHRYACLPLDPELTGEYFWQLEQNVPSLN